MLVVPAGQPSPLTQGAEADSGVSRDNGGLSVAGEGIGAVVHDGGVVVGYPVGAGVAGTELEELVLDTCKSPIREL